MSNQGILTLNLNISHLSFPQMRYYLNNLNQTKLLKCPGVWCSKALFHFVQTGKIPRWAWFYRFATATLWTNWVSLTGVGICSKYHNYRVLLKSSKWVAFSFLFFSFSFLILHLFLLQQTNKQTHRNNLIFPDMGLRKAVFYLPCSQDLLQLLQSQV